MIRLKGSGVRHECCIGPTPMISQRAFIKQRWDHDSQGSNYFPVHTSFAKHEIKLSPQLGMGHRSLGRAGQSTELLEESGFYLWFSYNEV